MPLMQDRSLDLLDLTVLEIVDMPIHISPCAHVHVRLYRCLFVTKTMNKFREFVARCIKLSGCLREFGEGVLE